MMILSQMALIVKVKLFEYSVTTMTKNSSSWAYQLQTLLFRCLMLLRQAITSLFQIEIITRSFHSLISAMLLLCRAVFFNPFAVFFNLQRDLPQMLVLLLEPYAMIQLSILLSAVNQMDGNGIINLFRQDPWQPLVEPWGCVEPQLKNTGVEDKDK